MVNKKKKEGERVVSEIGGFGWFVGYVKREKSRKVKVKVNIIVHVSWSDLVARCSLLVAVAVSPF